MKSKYILADNTLYDVAQVLDGPMRCGCAVISSVVLQLPLRRRQVKWTNIIGRVMMASKLSNTYSKVPGNFPHTLPSPHVCEAMPPAATAEDAPLELP